MNWLLIVHVPYLFLNRPSSIVLQFDIYPFCLYMHNLWANFSGIKLIIMLISYSFFFIFFFHLRVILTKHFFPYYHHLLGICFPNLFPYYYFTNIYNHIHDILHYVHVAKCKDIILYKLLFPESIFINCKYWLTVTSPDGANRWVWRLNVGFTDGCCWRSAGG